MFKDIISKPIDPIPSEYINQLKRLNCEPDYSLTCLGIALLRKRIEGYDGISGTHSYFTNEGECVADFAERYKALDNNPLFCYYIYNYKEPDRTVINNALKDFHTKENIGALIKNKAGAECTAVYHETKNCAAIFINSKDIRFYHMLISFMSLLFPALFKDKPLDDDDYNVIKTLSKTESSAFVQQIKKAVSPYLFEFRRLMLGNLLKQMHENKIKVARDSITTQRNSIKSIEQQYADALSYLKQLIVIYEGMKATECYDAPEEDLVEYLSTNKLLHNLNIANNKLTFVVATKLINYNENAWETFKKAGYIYDGDYTDGGRHTIALLDVFKKKENRKLLLDNLFSEDPEFSIKIVGNYCLNFDSSYVTTNKGYDYTIADPEFKSYMPNPHLKFFACLGGYERRINKALQDRNYISAIEMCCASAGSVDLDETEQTFRPFIGKLMMSREKVLVRKDGTEMTPEEALLYLIDKEKTNETDKDDTRS